ncbi:MAG: accessory gene regulator B family protein [Lachnospira sp.]
MNVYKFIEKYSIMDNRKREIVKFGLEMIRMLLISGIISILIAFFLKMLFEALIFLAVFIPLRQNAGGYHAKNKITCAIMSVIIYINTLYIIKNYNINGIMQLVLCFFNTVVIMYLAPASNNNNELDQAEREVYRHRTRIIFILELLIYMVLFISGLQYWSGIIIISVTIVSTLVCIGKIQNSIYER